MGRWTERGALPWIVAFIAVGLVLQIVGFATYHWTVLTTRATAATTTSIKTYSGLWEVCVKDGSTTTNTRICTNVDLDNIPDWYQAAQALECVGLVGYVVAFIVTFVIMKEPRDEREEHRYSLKIASITFLLLTGALIIIGAVIFIVKHEDTLEDTYPTTTTTVVWDLEPGYSSILCIIAGVIAIICILLVACLVYVPKPRWAFGWGDPYGPYGPRDYPSLPKHAKYGGYPRNVPPEYSMGSYRY